LISERKHESLLSLLWKAAGPEIIQYQFDEIVTSSIRIGEIFRCVWNEYNLKPLTSNYWRASLVPASAVIPAPRAYLKIVAVKKPVVEIRLQKVSTHRALKPCVIMAPTVSEISAYIIAGGIGVSTSVPSGVVTYIINPLEGECSVTDMICLVRRWFRAVIRHCASEF